jgi:hypothetical protein
MKKIALLLLACLFITQTFAEGRKLLFSCPTENIREFEDFVVKAKALGATHIFVSDLPKSRWQWEMDSSDPYPNWSMFNASIFKILPPPEIAKYIPAEYWQKNIEILKARAVVLKKHGLKAAFVGGEPGWLPEAVYRDHPDWRGARCEHPRRAKRAYFSPNIDNPEVLKLYREAYHQLCAIIPIESFSFLTDDSGGGICWSEGLYPGANGPAGTKNKPMKDRYVDFMSSIKQGAADAGLNASVNLFGPIPAFEMDAVCPSLPDGLSIKGRTANGKNNSATVSMGSYYNSSVYPVIGIPQMFKCVKQVSDAFKSSDADITIAFENIQSTELAWLVQQYRQKPYHDYLGQIEALQEVATQLVGKENAPEMVAAWNDIYLAVNSLAPIEGGGPILLLGSVNQRWLTRPLVPFPEELKPEEREYYRKFQFQANSEDEANDYNNLQGYELTRGFSGQYLANQLLGAAKGNIARAASRVEKISQNLTAGKNRTELQLLALRLKTLNCVIENAINTITYAYYLEITDKTKKPDETTAWHVPTDWRLKELQVITRAEIDNTYELIRILESASQPVLVQVKDQAQKDVFLFGPDLIGELKRKAETMLNHQMDYNRLYQRHN